MGRPAQGTGAERRTPTVLIVEDDVSIREDMAVLLEDEGYCVATADNGLAALEYLRGHEAPEVVLLDLMMPVMDGWALRLEMLRDADLSRIPIVIVSGAGDVAQEATTLAVAGFLDKPFTLTALLSVIELCCAAGARPVGAHLADP